MPGELYVIDIVRSLAQSDDLRQSINQITSQPDPKMGLGLYLRLLASNNQSNALKGALLAKNNQPNALKGQIRGLSNQSIY